MMRHAESVTTPTGRIEVVLEGSGPALVMLPSLGRDGYQDFDSVAAMLAASHTVLRPQPRGVGGSSGPLDGVSLHHMADDIAHVINALGGGRAAILGHAFGHFVARMTAVAHPDLVRGVVLAAAAARQYAPEIAATPRIAGNPDLPETERLAALRLGFFAAGHDPRPWLHGWHPATQRMQIDCREKQGVRQADWWGAGVAPLLELIPAQDPFKPREKWHELGAELGPRVQKLVIQGASHALFPEQPEAVAEAVAAWLITIPL
ncbi:MAG TPA: alpha/beta hydrolase [Acetobacteraceae bacterium]|nr:alpha/beta hydrolase [Acetobacteraceae bacterium]